MKYLADNIKWIRLLKGLSQSKFGELLGLSKDAIYTYEMGRTVPNIVSLTKIAKLAGVTITDLQNKDLRQLNINTINPDTKKMEFTLKESANQHDVNLLKHENENLREALRQRDVLITEKNARLTEKDERLTEKDERIKLLERMLSSSSKKS